MAKTTLTALALAATLALPVAAHAGGLAPGGPPSGWGGYEAPSVSQGRSHSPDRDRINTPGCRNGNKALCPRRGSDWWKARERERELLRPIDKTDPLPEIANPRPEKPGKPTRPPVVVPPTEPEAPAPVPLPAAGWLLGLALAAWGWLWGAYRRAVQPVSDTCACGGDLVPDLPAGYTCPECDR